MTRIVGALAGALFVATCAQPPGVSDSIDGVPAARQRTISRSQFDMRWPFTVGTGTLGCANGGIVFRAGGVTYAVDQAATTRYPPIDPIRARSSSPPSNPLSRITQEERMQIFASSAACARDAATAPACRSRLQETRRLSDAELTQIDVEGRERQWPPLAKTPVSLDPILEAGRALCGG